ncbi:sigma-54 interaction domain-containing protein [Youngiibacter multivorans]|uniref:Transcriptional regulator with PAS, ATPase and Fis domain n=1 Tax=Youngiibacter multivorans TaxID=937251 RepID=A0ABS4G4G8_9CLOT|nr:sigma 54-interacting transcriptional regulator [Youngiibacter multivorans]MBP1919429.1 transcriptional regulator with PAS, ATPase and Fis domain [Youngiibacter multivorans]
MVSKMKFDKFLSEEYLKVFNNLPDPIFVTDTKGNILLSNSTTAMVLDLTLDQLLNQNVIELVKKGHYNISYAIKAVEEKKTVTGLVELKNGIVYISTSTPVFDDSGAVQLVITSARPKDLIEGFINTNKREVEYLRNRVFGSTEIIAESKQMKLVLFNAHNVAPTDSTVILQGESGTGKEVLANYIHLKSKRAKEAFIAVNCAAFPENLVEAELFGYEKGSFTGAVTSGKMGLFEAAENGTLFLDEIAELPLTLQAKLLRVLETNEVRRIGSNISKKINFRLIAASHKNLEHLVDLGEFREDLFYRLNVYPLVIPPLRERPEDILALASKFLEIFNNKYEKEIQLADDELEALKKRRWSGNVRELRNFIERRVISSLNDFTSNTYASIISSEKVNCDIKLDKLFEQGLSLKDLVKKVEKDYIEYTIKKFNGSVREAAESLGVYRSVLYRKINEHNEM